MIYEKHESNENLLLLGNIFSCLDDGICLRSWRKCTNRTRIPTNSYGSIRPSGRHLLLRNFNGRPVRIDGRGQWRNLVMGFKDLQGFAQIFFDGRPNRYCLLCQRQSDAHGRNWQRSKSLGHGVGKNHQKFSRARQTDYFHVYLGGRPLPP